MRYFFISYRFRVSEEIPARVAHGFVACEGMININDICGKIEREKNYKVVVIQFFQEMTESDYVVASFGMEEKKVLDL